MSRIYVCRCTDDCACGQAGRLVISTQSFAPTKAPTASAYGQPLEAGRNAVRRLSPINIRRYRNGNRKAQPKDRLEPNMLRFLAGCTPYLAFSDLIGRGRTRTDDLRFFAGRGRTRTDDLFRVFERIDTRLLWCGRGSSGRLTLGDIVSTDVMRQVSRIPYGLHPHTSAHISSWVLTPHVVRARNHLQRRGGHIDRRVCPGQVDGVAEAAAGIERGTEAHAPLGTGRIGGPVIPAIRRPETSAMTAVRLAPGGYRSRHTITIRALLLIRWLWMRSPVAAQIRPSTNTLPAAGPSSVMSTPSRWSWR